MGLLFLFVLEAGNSAQFSNLTHQINLTPVSVVRKRVLFFRDAEAIFSSPDTLWEMLDFVNSKNVSTLVVNFPYIYMGDEEQEAFLAERVNLMSQKGLKTCQLLSFDENYNYTSAIGKFLKYNRNCYYRNEPNTAFSGAVLNGDSLLFTLKNDTQKVAFLRYFKELKDDLKEEQESSLGKFKVPQFYVAFSYPNLKAYSGKKVKFMGLKAPFFQHLMEISDGVLVFTRKENAGAVGSEVGDMLANSGMRKKPFWIIVVLTQKSKLFKMGLQELESLIKNEWWDYMKDYQNFSGFGFYPYEVYRYIED